MNPASIDKKTGMIAFKRFYTLSALLMCVLCFSGVMGSIDSGLFNVRVLIVSLSAAFAAVFPMVKKGGILGNLRPAICIAAIFTLASGTLIGMAFTDFVQTGGGEGPKGEGSPLANMIAIALGALLTACPWLITTLRGLPHWRTP